jgi:hypothetical protein
LKKNQILWTLLSDFFSSLGPKNFWTGRHKNKEKHGLPQLAFKTADVAVRGEIERIQLLFC